MNKNIKLIFIITAVVMLGCIGYSAYETFIKKDLLVKSEASCDPATEGPCYVWICEPNWWTECTGDPEEDIWVYKIIEKKAYDMPACEPVVKTEGFFTRIVEIIETCPEQECAQGGTDCTTVYCDPEIDGECYEDAKWDDYVAALRDSVSAACADKVGDYKGSPDYCAIVEGMDQTLLKEETTAEEDTPDINVDEESPAAEE